MGYMEIFQINYGNLPSIPPDPQSLQEASGSCSDGRERENLPISEKELRAKPLQPQTQASTSTSEFSKSSRLPQGTRNPNQRAIVPG